MTAQDEISLVYDTSDEVGYSPGEQFPFAPDDMPTDDIANVEMGGESEAEETPDIGEVNAENWRLFPDVRTDSLWIEPARWREGMHNGKYHGNFIPQIPYQAIRRFTKPGDVVLDAFLGSGTTLIECRRQGRHGIGIELIESIAKEAFERIQAETNPHGTWQEVIAGDSTKEDTVTQVRQVLKSHGRDRVQLLIMHPPYHDIIRFSDDPRDLCNSPTLADFLQSFQKVVFGTYDLLEENHFLVVVIGDKYTDKEWIPLGFRVMEAILPVGYTLKAIVVKNMEGNRAKRNLQNLWRQRAFRSLSYIFKHEYILFFQKKEFAANLQRVIDFARAIDGRQESPLLGKESFVSGTRLGIEASVFPSIHPTRILALRHRQVRAIAVDLSGLTITPEIERDIQRLIERLPPRVVDVSVIVGPEKRPLLQNLPGVGQLYTPDDRSLEQLAHTMYVVRKATGSGQRIGRASGVDFARALNAALQLFFEPGKDYERSARGIGFKFLRRDPHHPFGDEHDANFRAAIVTRWLTGHENEKIPQIRDRYYRKGFDLVAVVGSNTDRWKNLIREQGNFADYYLFIEEGEESSLEKIIQNRPLVKAGNSRSFYEIDRSLVDFLLDQKRNSREVEGAQ